MTFERRRLLVPVDDLPPGGPPGPAVVVGDLVLPGGDCRGLICCLPGGGMTRGYWDLGDTGFTRYAVRHGWAVLATDHPGTGESWTGAEAWYLPRHLAAAAVRVVECALEAIGVAGLPCIGFGHSLGAMVTVVAQADHRPYDGLVVCGFSRAGLPGVCTEEELSAAAHGLDDATLVRLAELRFKYPFPRLAGAGPGGRAFVGPDPDPAALAALRTCATNPVAAPALLSFLPGNVARQADTVHVPVLMGRGDSDPLLPARFDPADEFPASRHVEAVTIRGAGHNDVVSRSRHLWWERVLTWASGAHAR
jgi:pimeloyl-ACP methyl ester carboxylesterase